MDRRRDGRGVTGAQPNGNRTCMSLLTVARTVRLGLLILALGVGTVDADNPAPVREAMDLGGTWQATLDAENEGEREGWFKSGFAAEGWRLAPVPGSFAKVAPEIDRYEGPGWFQRSFRVPAAWRGRRVVVHFEGVNHTCKVWVNGRLVGENPDAFLGFELPVGPEIRFDQDNVIVVRVDNSRRRDIIPGGRLGWHPFGGILREVELRASDACRIESVKVTAEPAGTDGSLWLQAVVANGREKQKSVRLEVAVLDQKGAECARFTLGSATAEAGKQETFEGGKSLSGVQAWSPAQPALYTAEVQLVSEGRVIDKTVVRFGFRKIETRGEMLYLNGRPVFLTGFNRHEDSPKTDMSPDHERTRRELLMMKEMGCNFIRLCHYPQHPRTIDLCDEIGLLVMCEIPLYMWPGLEEGLENYCGTVASAQRQLTKMIDRDYNHPSVIFWSVSNEIHTQHPEVRGTDVILVQQAKGLDPTRLAVHVSDHWQQGSPRADSFGEDDVICLNGYPHPKEGPAWWSTRLEELHGEYPGKPILITEFGGEADREIAWQMGRLQAGFAGTTAPYVCGIAIWCWADHPWDKTWLKPPLSPYGVFSRDRQPRPSVEIAKEGFIRRQQEFATHMK
jgi:beta-galactosidase